MTFLSLAQAARCLSIDAKTLHRWLAEADLAVQSHPTDRRQKGVSRDHVDILARLHQRTVISLGMDPLALPIRPAPDPSALLVLSEQLATLHAQVAALQQQVADLTDLLQPHPAEPASPPPPPKSIRTSKRSPLSASTTAHSRRADAAPTSPRKPIHVIPRVEWDGMGSYVVICPQKGQLPLEPETPEWFDWLRTQSSFRFVGKEGTFSAHHEWRVKKGAWRAHRKIRNHTRIQRLAPTQELTIARLEQAAAALQALL